MKRGVKLPARVGIFKALFKHDHVLASHFSLVGSRLRCFAEPRFRVWGGSTHLKHSWIPRLCFMCDFKGDLGRFSLSHATTEPFPFFFFFFAVWTRKTIRVLNCLNWKSWGWQGVGRECKYIFRGRRVPAGMSAFPPLLAWHTTAYLG